MPPAKARQTSPRRCPGSRPAGAAGFGIGLLDTAIGVVLGHLLDERFLLCSTFKVLVVGLVLSRVDREQVDLARPLLAAGSTLSDNTAGNLLLASFGSPAKLTAFARRLGDDVTRLDGNEI